MGGPFAVGAGVSTSGAGIAQLARAELAFFYSELFGIDDLRLVAITYGGPGPVGKMGAGFRSFGGSTYREDVLWLGSGWMVGERVALGGAVKLMYLVIAGYGEEMIGGADVGIQTWPAGEESFALGMWIENVDGPSIRSAGERLPAAAHVGFHWRPTGQLLVAGEIFQERGFDPQYRVGQEISISPLVTLRAGIRTDPASFSAGLSVGNEQVVFDYAWRSHPVLGATQMAGVRIFFGMKDRDETGAGDRSPGEEE
jgi:hypothetical protein